MWFPFHKVNKMTKINIKETPSNNGFYFIKPPTYKCVDLNHVKVGIIKEALSGGIIIYVTDDGIYAHDDLTAFYKNGGSLIKPRNNVTFE